MTSSYYLLDTFTGEKFRGNPTPVCLLEKVLNEQTMHSFAKELNAPVTAFVNVKGQNGIYQIRYFTVTGEIPACGHATLGAAFVLFNRTGNAQITFETIEKIQLKATQDRNATFIEYPQYKRAQFETSIELKNALGIVDYETDFFCEELQSLFIELKNEIEVKKLTPDFKLLRKSADTIKEVIVMSKAENSDYDFVLRSFCPWIGIDEDPVTGSVHSVLGPFWKERLDKKELIAYQASERGGQLFIRVLKNSVQIGGYSDITAEGRLNLDSTDNEKDLG